MRVVKGPEKYFAYGPILQRYPSLYPICRKSFNLIKMNNIEFV